MIKKTALIFLSGIIILLLSVEGFARYFKERLTYSDSDESAVALSSADQDELLKENKFLKKRLTALSPNRAYIVVDTARNLLFLRNSNGTLFQAVVSSGSGNILRDPTGDREWVFDTPRGEFMVKEKIVGPNWIRPDWAFIEEGENIPKNWKDRVEEGVLGDYALAFGNGYFIHGTLYTRLLGRNVTHGCIRVGDKDLATIFKRAKVGTKIYIF